MLQDLLVAVGFCSAISTMVNQSRMHAQLFWELIDGCMSSYTQTRWVLMHIRESGVHLLCTRILSCLERELSQHRCCCI